MTSSPAFPPAGGATGAPSSTSPGACGFPPCADLGAGLVEKAALPAHWLANSGFEYGDWRRHDARPGLDANELSCDEYTTATPLFLAVCGSLMNLPFPVPLIFRHCVGRLVSLDWGLMVSFADISSHGAL